MEQVREPAGRLAGQRRVMVGARRVGARTPGFPTQLWGAAESHGRDGGSAQNAWVSSSALAGQLWSPRRQAARTPGFCPRLRPPPPSLATPDTGTAAWPGLAPAAAPGRGLSHGGPVTPPARTVTPGGHLPLPWARRQRAEPASVSGRGGGGWGAVPGECKHPACTSPPFPGTSCLCRLGAGTLSQGKLGLGLGVETAWGRAVGVEKDPRTRLGWGPAWSPAPHFPSPPLHRALPGAFQAGPIAAQSLPAPSLPQLYPRALAAPHGLWGENPGVLSAPTCCSCCWGHGVLVPRGLPSLNCGEGAGEAPLQPSPPL